MVDGIIIACFSVVMACNVVALVRHWMALRYLNIAIASFIEQQREFAQFMEAERGKRPSIAPE